MASSAVVAELCLVLESMGFDELETMGFDELATAGVPSLVTGGCWRIYADTCTKFLYSYVRSVKAWTDRRK